MSYSIRLTTEHDAPAVTALVLEATRWLAERGSDQWQYPPQVHAKAISAAIRRGSVWGVADEAETLIGTITIDERADPEFWTVADEPDTALYIHRMAVCRALAGREIGAAMMDWASARAVEAGKRWLRLDAWSRNPELQRYYERHGFELVRLLRFEHRGSGALYQRPAGYQERIGPSLSPESANR
jgi:ribosomal protein S18 acetylase RimI-like enzyme